MTYFLNFNYMVVTIEIGREKRSVPMYIGARDFSWKCMDFLICLNMLNIYIKWKSEDL